MILSKRKKEGDGIKRVAPPGRPERNCSKGLKFEEGWDFASEERLQPEGTTLEVSLVGHLD